MDVCQKNRGESDRRHERLAGSLQLFPTTRGTGRKNASTGGGDKVPLCELGRGGQGEEVMVEKRDTGVNLQQVREVSPYLSSLFS